MLSKFYKRKETVLLLSIFILIMLISIENPYFLKFENLFSIIMGSVVLGIAALGMLVVMIAGGIDLSIGAMISAVSVIIGKYMVCFGGNIVLVSLLACLTGVTLGAINGILISKLEAPAIIITVATMSILRGMVQFFSNGKWVTNLPSYFVSFGNIKVFNIFHIQILILLISIVLTVFVLKYTRVGRGIYAVGENAITALRVGYNIKKVKLFLYTFCGLMAGIAGLVHTSIMKQVDPNALKNFELEVIAVVILGGTNIMGGAGSVLGTYLGVIFYVVLNNGLVFAHIPVFWQKIIVGCIIILMVSYDMIQYKKRERILISEVD
ncbi:MAG: rhamnose transport system permease protein [Clostridiales bacterium]|jgi:simple sugar transport system permease protein/ribose transport system permease protein|nr:rhamnose transport system permease protein [Clostridiales bacterium]